MSSVPGSLSLCEVAIAWPEDWPEDEFGRGQTCLTLAAPGLPLPTVFIPAGMTDTVEAIQVIGPAGGLIDGSLVTTLGGKQYHLIDSVTKVAMTLATKPE